MDRLVEACARALAGRVGQDSRLRLERVAVLSAQEFRRTADEPTSLFDSAGPSAWPVPGLVLDFSPSLAFGLIDLLLGGRGNETPLRTRALTAVQRRLLAMAARSIAQAVAQTLGQTGGPAGDTSILAAGWVDVEAGRARGLLRLGVPTALVEALGHRRLEASTALVELRVQLPEATVSPGQLSQLAPGDIVDTELPADAAVEIVVDGQVRFTGQLGRSNSRRAVRLTDPAQSPAEPTRD
jgi:flagellar motor switch protein FliM